MIKNVCFYRNSSLIITFVVHRYSFIPRNTIQWKSLASGPGTLSFYRIQSIVAGDGPATRWTWSFAEGTIIGTAEIHAGRLCDDYAYSGPNPQYENGDGNGYRNTRTIPKTDAWPEWYEHELRQDIFRSCFVIWWCFSSFKYYINTHIDGYTFLNVCGFTRRGDLYCIRRSTRIIFGCVLSWAARSPLEI